MSSSGSESEMEIDCTPLDLRSEAKLAMENLLPVKSKENYMKTMFLLLLLLAAALPLGWVYLRWMRVRSYWAERGVPHLPPHPIMGSLTFLQKVNPGIWMREMYNKFRAPYFGIWLFWQPALVINSPEIARRVLVKDADNFRDRFLSSGKSDPIGGLNIFTVNEPTWSSIRRRLTAVFTSSKLRALHDLISTKAKQIVQRIRNEIKQNKTTDLRVVFSDFTTDVIGTAAFGVAGDATLTGDSPIRRITKEFQKFSILRGMAWCSIFFFPRLVDIFGFKMFPKESTDYFRKIFRMVVKDRGGYEKEPEGRDLLDAIIKIKRDAIKNNEDMDEDILVSQASIFIQGGFDTSASALTFMAYELAYHPEIQERLYQELLEAKQENGSDDFEPSVYSKLTYLNCVIKETLRKYPAMGWLDRIAAKDYKIDENLTISAGTPIYVNAVGMQTDPEFFPEPEKFDPDRFLPENEKNIQPFTYMPFGEGPRNCIGMRFGYQNIRYAMTSVVLNFEMRPLPNAPPPSEAEVEKRGLFFMPGGVYSVQFVPRT